MGKAIHIISLNTLADLKLQPGSESNVIITLGLNQVGDNGGALYYWDPVSTDAEDTAYYNTVQVTGMATGRYKKVFQRMLNLPQGMLIISNGKKELFVDTVVSANSDAQIYLTYDNTATGAAIFNQVKFDDSKATINTSTANDAVSSYRKSLSADKKTLIHGFYRGNSSVVAVLNVTVLGFRSAVQNTPVTFKVEGI